MAAGNPSTNTNPRFRVGCAGWAIASAHRHLFGAGESVLTRYATAFKIAEINSSFHRPHRRETYQRWAAAVPADFRFSVKLPKAITHELRLRQAGPLLDRFIDETSGLGNKLGCLLVQLPPTLVFDARLASTFLLMLRRRWAGGIAFEPRHLSWFGAAADALWVRHGIARVRADPAVDAAAGNASGSGSIRYWRWHGSPRIYYSDYDDKALRNLAAEVIQQTPAGTQRGSSSTTPRMVMPPRMPHGCRNCWPSRGSRAQPHERQTSFSSRELNCSASIITGTCAEAS